MRHVCLLFFAGAFLAALAAPSFSTVDHAGNQPENYTSHNGTPDFRLSFSGRGHGGEKAAATAYFRTAALHHDDKDSVGGTNHARPRNAAIFRAKSPLSASLAVSARQDKKRDYGACDGLARVKKPSQNSLLRLQAYCDFPPALPPLRTKAPGKRPDDPRASPDVPLG